MGMGWGKYITKVKMKIEKKRMEREPNRDFNGDTGVNTMLVIEINARDIKSLQAGLTGSADVSGVTADLPFAVRQVHSKFGCQLDLVSHPSLETLPLI